MEHKEVMINIRLTEEDRIVLGVWAKREGISMSDVIRQYIRSLGRKLKAAGRKSGHAKT